MIEINKTPEELREENRRLRLELHTLRFKELAEQRFIWWIWNEYAKSVEKLIYSIVNSTTYDTNGKAKIGVGSIPEYSFDLIKRVYEYTEHIYDGTLLDVEISMDAKGGIRENKPEPSNSDVSATENVVKDIKTGIERVKK